MSPRFLLAIAVLASGCGEDSGCTLVGCGSHLTLVLDPPYVEAGTYRVEVETKERGIATCEVVLGATLDPGSCVFGIGSSNDAVDLGVVTMGSSPDRVTLRIWRGSTELLDASLPPDYEIVEPNGPVCGPTCRVATMTIAR